jgi:hypothetical protein
MDFLLEISLLERERLLSRDFLQRLLPRDFLLERPHNLFTASLVILLYP